MSSDEVKKFVADNNIVPIKADKTQINSEVDKLLAELGNNGLAIPFYAVYPSDGGEPITFGNLITSGQVISALQTAIGDVPAKSDETMVTRSGVR